MVLLFLVVLMSLFSTTIMTYLSMNTDFGIWLAPALTIIMTLGFLPLTSKRWFRDDILIIIASSSLGGMIGICVGWTFSDFYFLQKPEFTVWMSSPLYFSTMVFSLVVTAGFFAFVVANILRIFAIKQFPFPVSQLIYTLLYKDSEQTRIKMMLQGGIGVTIWNILKYIMLENSSFILAYPLMHLNPLLLAIGFVVSSAFVIPFFIGVCSQVALFYGIHGVYYQYIKLEQFVLMFICGMLLATFIVKGYLFLKKVYQHRLVDKELDLIFYVTQNLRDRFYLMILAMSLLLSSLVLSFWQLSIVSQLFTYALLFFVMAMITIVMGSIGIADLKSYTALLVVFVLYFVDIPSLGILALFTFSALSIGLLSDLLFSYKLADLSKLDHTRLLKYQVIGFVASAVSIGFVLWIFLGSLSLKPCFGYLQDSMNYSSLIISGDYSSYVILYGMLYALVLQFFVEDIFVVIGGIIMPLSASVWLLLSGFIAMLIPNKERLRPVWFGIYAFHVLWLLIYGLLYCS